MLDKIDLFPEATTIDTGGQLILRGRRAVDLVARFGTPLYLYDTPTIHRQIAAYRQALAAYPGPARLTYAGKAFLCTAMARLMSQAGLGLEVASAGELSSPGRAGPTRPRCTCMATIKALWTWEKPCRPAWAAW